MVKADFFTDPQIIKTNADNYISHLQNDLIPEFRRLYPHNDYIFIQDSAPSHRAMRTQHFLAENVPDFVRANEWPPNSPDCNPLDYSVWNALQEEVYSGRREPFENLRELRERIELVWPAISQNVIRRAILQFKPRLRAVSLQNGGPIQHIFK